MTRKVDSELEVNVWFFTGVALNESPCSVSASATLRVSSASDIDSLYDSLYDSLVTAYLTWTAAHAWSPGIPAQDSG